MHSRLYTSCLSAIIIAGLTMGTRTPSAQAASNRQVTVTLRENVQIPHVLVAMRDLATITGGTELKRAAIGKLDISELDTIGAQDVVSRERITYRLLLNGFSKDDVQVVGRSVRVKRREKLSSDEMLLDTIRPILAKALRVKTEDLELRLMRPIAKLSEYLHSDFELVPFPPEKPRLGAFNMRVGVHQGGNLFTTFPVSLQVKLLRTVPVAQTLLSPRDILHADDVQWARQAVTARDLLVEGETIVGRALRRRVSPGQVLMPVDLSVAPTKTSAEYVIKSRDNVRLVAKKGQLRVVLGGAVSLQRGRIGQVIRFQNPSTRKIVFGKIIDSGTAEIQL